MSPAIRRLCLALLVALPFLALHLAGLRGATAAISGEGVPGLAAPLAALLGAAYAASWLALVVIAPPLVIAAALEGLWGRFLPRFLPHDPPSGDPPRAGQA
jgi:hypothetical protein